MALRLTAAMVLIMETLVGGKLSEYCVELTLLGGLCCRNM